LENTIASSRQSLYIDGSPIARARVCFPTNSRLSVGNRDAIDYRAVFHLTAHAPPRSSI